MEGYEDYNPVREHMQLLAEHKTVLQHCVGKLCLLNAFQMCLSALMIAWQCHDLKYNTHHPVLDTVIALCWCAWGAWHLPRFRKAYRDYCELRDIAPYQLMEMDLDKYIDD